MTYEAYCEKYEKELDTLAEGGDKETKNQNKNPYARIEAYLSKHTYLVCEHATRISFAQSSMKKWTAS